MKGSGITNLKLIKVINGNTIKILLENEQESIRLTCLDTEASQHISHKPITNAGILAWIWNPATNAGGDRRDYTTLIPWWHLRDSVVQDYRYSVLQVGVLSVRLDYDHLLEASRVGNEVRRFLTKNLPAVA